MNKKSLFAWKNVALKVTIICSIKKVKFILIYLNYPLWYVQFFLSVFFFFFFFRSLSFISFLFSAFQTSYSYFFGAYATFLFVRTGIFHHLSNKNFETFWYEENIWLNLGSILILTWMIDSSRELELCNLKFNTFLNLNWNRTFVLSLSYSNFQHIKSSFLVFFFFFFSYFHFC